jgi:hypothetical protein
MGLLPPSTNATYRGARLSAWFLLLAAGLTIGPGLVHTLAPDGGAQTIAGLDLGDRRDVVVGVFRWEGATQLAFGLAMAAVALRYQPLTPLFLALFAFEETLVALEGWVLAPPANGHHPPAHYGAVVMVIAALVFVALALRPRTR